MLGQLLSGPGSDFQANLKELKALTRALRRLTMLRSELQGIGEDALEPAKTAYAAILSTVTDNLGAAGNAEIERLGMLDVRAESFSEMRIAVAQLHGWLDHVVASMETKREAEQMLGGSFDQILSEASLVPPAEQQVPTPVGMYL